MSADIHGRPITSRAIPSLPRRRAPGSAMTGDPVPPRRGRNADGTWVTRGEKKAIAIGVGVVLALVLVGAAASLSHRPSVSLFYPHLTCAGGLAVRLSNHNMFAPDSFIVAVPAVHQ